MNVETKKALELVVREYAVMHPRLLELVFAGIAVTEGSLDTYIRLMRQKSSEMPQWQRATIKTAYKKVIGEPLDGF